MVRVVVPDDRPDTVSTPLGPRAETVKLPGPVTPTATNGLVKSMPIGNNDKESGCPTQTGPTCTAFNAEERTGIFSIDVVLLQAPEQTIDKLCPLRAGTRLSEEPVPVMPLLDT